MRDVFLADYMMPGMSGIDWCAKFREQVPRAVSIGIPTSSLSIFRAFIGFLLLEDFNKESRAG